MRIGAVTVSDELLLRALGFDRKTVIVGIRRDDSFTSTHIIIVHPKLPNLIEGAIPPPIQISDTL